MLQYKKQLGARLLSEANDLKRTVASMAKEIDYPEESLQAILAGQRSIDDMMALIQKMGQHYPIDIGDLYLPQPDSKNGVVLMSLEASKLSARIFSREDKDKKLSPYYEYRDTALSNRSPFKPEWIKQLRVVQNADPNNPDVQYNHGHFLHQTTFFVGPVNFYWEWENQRYCKEMNTGDSNYITPFVPHSFTAREPDQPAYIIAVTFGGEVRRAQKEIYGLGEQISKTGFIREDVNQAFWQLLNQHCQNECISLVDLKQQCHQKGMALPQAYQNWSKRCFDEVASILNILPNQLYLPDFNQIPPAVVTHRFQSDGYDFPCSGIPSYRIRRLACVSHLPMKAFDFEVLVSTMPKMLTSSLHSYLFNYGDKPLTLVVENKGLHSMTLAPSTSAYIEPFIPHGLKHHGDPGECFIVRTGGAYNLATQIELSAIKDRARVFSENKCWFKQA